jgi:hypothetical protein
MLKPIGLSSVLVRRFFFPELFFKLLLLTFFKRKVLGLKTFAFGQLKRFQKLFRGSANEIKHRAGRVRKFRFVVADAEFEFFLDSHLVLGFV